MLTMDALIRLMFEKKASDLHLSPDSPPALRIDGEIVPTELEVLQPTACAALVFSVLTDEQRARFERDSELKVSFGLENIGRVRMQVIKQRGLVVASLRGIPLQLPTFEELGLPPILADIVQLPKGLVIVAGPTASGKSTTLAAMVEWINQNKSVHILTLEDPIEYQHAKGKAIVHQREIGSDTPSNTAALKSVLYSDPDVILLGEMHDAETLQAALRLAETGHLVFGALPVTDSVQAITQLVDAFEPHQQYRVRMQLSIVLQAVLIQQLLPRGYASGRVLACEILIPTSAVRSLIREEKENQVYALMQTGGEYGMQTMNQALYELYQKQLVTYNEIFSRTTDPRDLQQLVKGTM
jgi:twitching motility protein PilT